MPVYGFSIQIPLTSGMGQKYGYDDKDQLGAYHSGINLGKFVQCDLHLRRRDEAGLLIWRRQQDILHVDVERRDPRRVQFVEVEDRVRR